MDAAILKMVSSLLVVLGLMALTYYLVKRFLRPGLFTTKPLIHVLATASLGIKKEVVLISVSGVYLVLGVTPYQVTLLSQLDSFPSDPPNKNE